MGFSTFLWIVWITLCIFPLWGLYIQFYLPRCIYRNLFMRIPAFSGFSPFFFP